MVFAADPGFARFDFSSCHLERFKKNCGRSERGFLGFGEALAKEQVCKPCD
jgi:hypothetical protein